MYYASTDDPNVNAMGELAQQYAEELDTQFRRLNKLVTHQGEIGRAHEAYLRGVLARFFPERIRIGTGFIAGPRWTSPQQDIILFDRTNSVPLFEVGDCVVADAEAVGAAIEVKTKITDSDAFETAYRGTLRNLPHIGSSRFSGLFMWEGPSLDLALNAIWNYVRENPLFNNNCVGIGIYARSKYILVANYDGKRHSPPYRCLDLAGGKFTEGEGLLWLMDAIWQHGHLHFRGGPPWWLKAWSQNLNARARFIPWPNDLQAILNHGLPAEVLAAYDGSTPYEAK